MRACIVLQDSKTQTDYKQRHKGALMRHQTKYYLPKIAQNTKPGKWCQKDDVKILCNFMTRTEKHPTDRATTKWTVTWWKSGRHTSQMWQSLAMPEWTRKYSRRSRKVKSESRGRKTQGMKAHQWYKVEQVFGYKNSSVPPKNASQKHLVAWD